MSEPDHAVYVTAGAGWGSSKPLVVRVCVGEGDPDKARVLAVAETERQPRYRPYGAADCPEWTFYPPSTRDRFGDGRVPEGARGSSPVAQTSANSEPGSFGPLPRPV